MPPPLSQREKDRYRDIRRVARLLDRYFGNDPSVVFSSPSLHLLVDELQKRTRAAERATVKIDELLDHWRKWLPKFRSEVMHGIPTKKYGGRSIRKVTEDDTWGGFGACPPGPPKR